MKTRFIPSDRPAGNRLCVIFALAALFLVLLPAAAAAENGRVLVLNSYHRGFQWSDAEMSGIESWFVDSDIKPQLHFEYMDSKRMAPDVATRHMFVLLREKYSRDYFDVLMAADDNAFELLRTHRQTLFPGVPLVFCGVNLQHMPRGSMPERTTGVLERVDVEGTLSLALSMHPATRSVVFVADGTTTGQRMLHAAREARRGFAGRVDFTELNNLPAPKLQEALRLLPSSSVVVLLSFLRDRNGRVLTVEECVRLLTQASPVPVYGVGAQFIAAGLAGGTQLSGTEHGRQAARLAEQILRGADPSELSIIAETPVTAVLDYRQLSRFGVSLPDLPDGVIVRNLPQGSPSVWWYGAGLAAAAAMALLFRHWRNRRCMPACEDSATALGGVLAAMQHMNDICLLLDTAGRIAAMNRPAEQASGIDSHAAEGMLPEAVLPMLAGALEKLRRGLQHNDEFCLLQAEARMDNGLRRFDLEASSLLPVAAGALLVLRDVTDRAVLEAAAVGVHRLSLVTRMVSGMCHGAKEPLSAVVQNAEELHEVLFEDTEGNARAAARCGCSLSALRGYLGERDVPRRVGLLRAAGAELTGIVSRLPNAERRSPERPMPLKDVVDNALRLGRDDPRLREYGMGRVGWRIEADGADSVQIIRAADAELVVYEMITLGLYALMSGEASPGGVLVQYGATPRGGRVVLTASGCSRPVDIAKLLRSERMFGGSGGEMSGYEGFALATRIAEHRFGAPLKVESPENDVRIEFMLNQE
jgi:PAS domain-containing protein